MNTTINNNQELDTLTVKQSSNPCLTILGIFHSICLAAIVLIPAFKNTADPNGKPSVWWMPVILANVFIAVGLTVPLSKNKPGVKWQSLWFLWFFVGYLAVFALIRGDLAFTSWRFKLTAPPMPYWELPISLLNRDIFIAIGCLFLMGFLIWLIRRDILKQRWLGWRLWLVLAVLLATATLNHELLLIPSFLLICIGCYVAFASLGRVWLWRAILVTVCAAVIPCVMLIHSFFIKINTNKPGTEIEINNVSEGKSAHAEHIGLRDAPDTETIFYDPADVGIDGNPNAESRWTTYRTGNQRLETYEVDLGEAYYINRIILRLYDDTAGVRTPKQYSIYYMKPGENSYAHLLTNRKPEGSPDGTKLNETSFPEVKAQKIKVELIKRDGYAPDEGIGFTEIEVYNDRLITKTQDHQPRTGFLGLFDLLRDSFGVLPGNHPLYLAVWLICFPPMTLAAALAYRRWPRALLFMVLAIQVIALILTIRRTVWYALPMMVLVGLVLSGRVKLLNALLLILVLLTVGACLLWSGALSQDIFTACVYDEGHYFSCYAGLVFFLHNPLWGVGPGRYFEHALLWEGEQGIPCGYEVPHNDYICLLAEDGLVGFVLGMGVGIQLLLILRRLITKETQRPIRLLAMAMSTQIIALALTVSILLAGFSRPVWNIPNAALIASILGAVWAKRGET